MPKSNKRLEQIQICFEGGQWEVIDLYRSFSKGLFVSHARL